MTNAKLQVHIAPRLRALLLSALLALTLGAVPVRADADRAELALPVRCVGPACTAALFDAGGNLAAQCSLDEDGEGLLRFSVSGPGLYRFLLRVLEESGGALRYDPTRYAVLVTAAPSEDGTELLATISVYGEGEDKLEEVVFRNEREPAPTPTPTPEPTPEPTPRPGTTPKPETTPEPTETPQPTGSPEPTETPQPTGSPEPSETPQPTGSPKPTPGGPPWTPSPLYPPGSPPEEWELTPPPVPLQPFGPGNTPPPEPPDDEDWEEDIDIDNDDVPLATILPQTGQLWWPVPVLALTGLLLLTAGLVETARSKAGKRRR